jgi:LysR family transcriptional regulator, glycine cleavage system transcriptional activator
MLSRLPLEGFRFFEAAARHLSFTKAAAELCVTHGAVSQRIKSMERELKAKLFLRDGRNMLLTATGSELYRRVRIALNEIDRAVELVRNGRIERPLTVSAIPAFATRWLIPRLSAFNRLHPDVLVNIRASLALADFDRDGVDIAIRFGAGVWPDMKADKLFDDELFPVCAPNFRAGKFPSTPAQLLNLPLLHDERQPWSIWFSALGSSAEPTIDGPTYGDGNLLLEAAAAGHGIALARGSFVEQDLAAGRLIRLFDFSAKTRYSHYLVYPAHERLRRTVDLFRQWILDEASEQAESGQTKPATARSTRSPRAAKATRRSR